MTTPPEDAPSECGHDANALLDFHVNGSLEVEEAAMVAAHVAECATCARDVQELQGLSTAIETYGTAAPSGWSRGRRVGTWIGAATAVLLVGAGVYSFVRQGPGGVRPAVPQAEHAEVALDLGTGGLRDATAGPPSVALASGTSSLRLTLFPPVLPERPALLLSMRGPGELEIVTERPLPPLDPMGRAAIVVPASRFAAPGTYQVILRSAAVRDGSFTYPFEVRPADLGDPAATKPLPRPSD